MSSELRHRHRHIRSAGKETVYNPPARRRPESGRGCNGAGSRKDHRSFQTVSQPRRPESLRPSHRHRTERLCLSRASCAHRSFHTPANTWILIPSSAGRTRTDRVRELLPPEAPPASLSSTQVSGMTAAGGRGSSLWAATAFTPALPATRSHARPGPPARSPALWSQPPLLTLNASRRLCLGPTLSTTVAV